MLGVHQLFPLRSSGLFLIAACAATSPIGACAGAGASASGGRAAPRPASVLTGRGVPANDSTGWALTNVLDGRFRLSTDRAVAHGGKASGRLEPMPDYRGGSGTIEQTVRAERYRGQRVRIRSWIRAQNVARGLVTVSVYGEHESSMTTLRMYTNGIDAPVAGTHDWKAVDRVIEVPQHAANFRIFYSLTPSLAAVTRGAAGVLWVDDVTLEVVGPNVPLSVNSQGRIGAAVPDTPPELEEKRARIAKAPAAVVNGGFEVEVEGVSR